MTYATIYRYLKAKNIPLSVAGFNHLAGAIKLKDVNPRKKMMEIYEHLAIDSKTTANAVERAMRHAISRSGLAITNKEFIAQALYDLKYGVESEADNE